MMVLTGADWFAGLSLLLIGIVGVGLHLLEIAAMSKLTCRYVGFRFILSHSVADILLLLQFGIWPGMVVFTKNSFIPEFLRVPVHVYMDGVWYAMCYMSVVISITRLMCVRYPIRYRQLSHRACFYISLAAWVLAFVQSGIIHSMPWFESLYYNEQGYGMTGDWKRHATEGTQTYYLTTSALIVAGYVIFYSTAAFTIVVRRNAILRITHPQPRASINSARTRNSITSVALTRRNQAIAVEIRLMIPCAASAIIYIVGQILINGAVGQGKWTGYAVMVIFSLQSLVSPILRVIFSETLRREMYKVIFRRTGKFSTPLFTVSELPSIFRPHYRNAPLRRAAAVSLLTERREKRRRHDNVGF